MNKGLKFTIRNKIKHKVKLNRRIIDFNKEILIGEIGALIGSPLFGFIGSQIGKDPVFISFFTLFGSVLGGSISWLITRIYDEKKYGDIKIKRISKDISVFTPVAFLISILVSYPTIFFVTHYWLLKRHVSYLSSFIGEVSGFCIFLILINIYRVIMNRYFNKLI